MTRPRPRLLGLVLLLVTGLAGCSLFGLAAAQGEEPRRLADAGPHLNGGFYTLDFTWATSAESFYYNPANAPAGAPSVSTIKTLAHYLGRGLGLNKNVTQSASIMNENYFGRSSVVRSVTDGDRAGAAYQHTVSSFSGGTLAHSVVLSALAAPNPNQVLDVFNITGDLTIPVRFRYVLPEATRVSLQVYDLLGRAVATLVAGEQAAGAHRVVFDGSGLSSGVYLYRLEAGSEVVSGKMPLLK